MDNSFSYPHGLSTPAAQVAMIAKRYMHLSGATSRDFGAISVADRKHAAKNPKAYFYEKPITIEDHQNSRWIAEPLRLLDCCQETDGGVAIVVTSAGAGQGPQAPAGGHRGGGAGFQPGPVLDGQLLPAGAGAARDGSGRPAAVGAVGAAARPTSRPPILYDHFTPFTLIQLEELGFCGRGEAKDFIADGAIEIGGRLPINTHGGQLGEAYIHGMNGIAEGVRQLRGTSVNQVDDVEHVLVTAGTGVPTSGSDPGLVAAAGRPVAAERQRLRPNRHRLSTVRNECLPSVSSATASDLRCGIDAGSPRRSSEVTLGTLKNNCWNHLACFRMRRLCRAW